MLCPSCGRNNPSDAQFCNGCGANLDTPVAETPTPSEESGVLISGSFVGRHQEMAGLKAALENAMSGQGRLIMLVGEPGIGKTRTAQELAAQAQALGAQVLWGGCYEEEGAPPYWPWVQPISSYVRQTDPDRLRSEMGLGAADIAEIVSEIQEKLPDLEPSPALEPEQARFRLFDSITTFLKNASQSQPLLLVLDDLHWADRPSLLLLQFLVRRLAGSQILVLGCYRDVELSRQHPLSETLAQLSREPAFGREVLRGLSREDTGRFIEVAVGLEPPPGIAETIHRHTEGNPYFITEVVRLLTEQGEVFGASSTLPPGQRIRIPEGVREVIGQRLNHLSEHCNQALTIASIIGREFDFRLLDTLSEELTEDQLLTVIDEALQARLIEELPGGMDRYQFSHALVQETLSAELSTSRRVRLHARIGEELENRYGNNAETHAAELAYHFAEAEPVLGPDKLVRYSLLAGEQALAAYAYEEAIGHYERALAVKVGQPTDTQTAALLFGLGRAQAATLPRHQHHEAVTSLSRALDYYTESGDIPSAVAVAECPIPVVLGQRTGASELLKRVLALVPSGSLEAGNLLCRYGRLMSHEEGDYPAAQEAFGQALAIAQQEGDLALEMRTLANAAQADMTHNNFAEGATKSRRAIELAGRVDDPHAEVNARWQLTQFLAQTYDLEGARREGAAMLATAERLRDRSWLTTALFQNAQLAQDEGDWPTVRGYCDRALEVEPTDPRALATRARMGYETGDFDRGEADLEKLLEIMRLIPPGPTMGHGFLAALIPRIAQVAGVFNRLDDAKAAAEAILASSSATQRVITAARGSLALQAILQGDMVKVQEHYLALESLRGTTIRYSRLAVDRLLGLLCVTLGKLDMAANHFEDAVAFCSGAGYRPELAWTCHDYAETLLHPSTSSGRGAPGNREKAKSLLEESLAISTELGMRPLMERVVALQERLQSQPARAPVYPDGLTQREVEVLRLVAAGKTDREIAGELFIGVRTVTTHVSNILNKVNAVNRTEATAYATRRGLA